MTPEELSIRLAPIRAKRGYLLPHHGLLAITSPNLLQAYDQLYTVLALDHKTLSVRDRELVWLAVLVATDEALATHHIARFLQGGGHMAEFNAVLQLTASLKGVTAYGFVRAHWAAHVPTLDLTQSYRDAMERAGQPLTARDVWMCACSVHAALGHLDGLREALLAAYARRVDELDLAEALGIMMFPGSVPHYVNAAKVWMSLIREGQVQASPAFAAWARMDGQGGHDEASGQA
jgi:alkylhydroperoxidase/carboxymuconolactone decarboxylase family protein YurZ